VSEKKNSKTQKGEVMVFSTDWTKDINLKRGDVVYGMHKELDKIYNYSLPTFCNVSSGGTLYKMLKNYEAQYEKAAGGTERYLNKDNRGVQSYKSYIDQVLICTEGRVFFLLDGVTGIEYITERNEDRKKKEIFKDLGLMVTYSELKHVVKLLILDKKNWLKERIVFIEQGTKITTETLLAKIAKNDLEFYKAQLTNQYKNILWYWAGKEWNGGKLNESMQEIEEKDPEEIVIGNDVVIPLFLLEEKRIEDKRLVEKINRTASKKNLPT
jgi:hypothetical protein